MRGAIGVCLPVLQSQKERVAKNTRWSVFHAFKKVWQFCLARQSEKQKKNLGHLFKQTHENKTTSSTDPAHYETERTFNAVLKKIHVSTNWKQGEGTKQKQRDVTPCSPADLFLVSFRCQKITDGAASRPTEKMSWLPKVWVRPESSWIFWFSGADARKSL